MLKADRDHAYHVADEARGKITALRANVAAHVKDYRKLQDRCDEIHRQRDELQA